MQNVSSSHRLALGRLKSLPGACRAVTAGHWHLLARAGWVAALSLGVKLSAMTKDIVVAGRFGASADLDAFLVAYAVPMVVWSIVSQSFSSSFMPTLIRVREQSGPSSAHELIRSMMAKVIVGLAVLAVLLAAGAPWFLPVLAPGFDPQQRAVTLTLCRILLWIVPCCGLATYWGAILNSCEVFTVVAMAPASFPVMMLVSLYGFVPRFGIEALAWGAVAGYAAEMLILGGAMLRRRLPVLPSLRAHDQAGHMVRQYLFLLSGAVLMSSTILVDQSMATWTGQGSVTVLNYGNKPVAVLLGTISLGVGTAVFPHFSRLAASGDAAAIRKTLRSLVLVVTAITIPLTAVLMLLSRPLAEALFQRGAITPETISAIARVQCCYLLQVPAYVAGILGVRTLMALGGASTITRIAAANLGVNVVANLVFLRFFGIAGIALSTSCVYLFSTTLVYYRLAHRLRKLAPLPEAVWEGAKAA
ncbi:MAG TPA: lipid II flippase MurJ [Pirellulales bacterium]|jgi:putative peptidoglycan lipid II flippase|nr:lipid II flippase MurJ [Pirellulales bacterium]